MSADQAAALIEVHGLELELAGRLVLDIETLRIERGQVVTLVGPNGSGKTTLLKLAAGLLRARRGRFSCLGTAMSPRQAANFCRGRHIYLHQTPYMFDATVEDNVAYGLKQRGRDFTQRRIEIRDALAWAQLDHLVHRRAAELSVGERQRVALTRARILAPSLLLLDEITANMDENSRRRSLEMIADLKRSGSSVVFATHDHAPLAALSDTMLELDQGRLVGGRRAAAAVIPLRRERGTPEKP